MSRSRYRTVALNVIGLPTGIGRAYTMWIDAATKARPCFPDAHRIAETVGRRGLEVTSSRSTCFCAAVRVPGRCG